MPYQLRPPCRARAPTAASSTRPATCAAPTAPATCAPATAGPRPGRRHGPRAPGEYPRLRPAGAWPGRGRRRGPGAPGRLLATSPGARTGHRGAPASARVTAPRRDGPPLARRQRGGAPTRRKRGVTSGRKARRRPVLGHPRNRAPKMLQNKEQKPGNPGTYKPQKMVSGRGLTGRF